ncbi:SURP and G-patch domain-containing protein 2 [Sceloporus undulatus]|uniref:SURP and G-patch domain-containing protein 2 n=1 Tax=Sceloporus undulatus TaxID=8520 RepID=UPI001C4A7E24|nr:SURP and G-patch domain-containing protein 2 [Sceloporus undulatus]XP_042297653.1 SURP and G-patch domain-containing protein 2 [Sceloporus undulatus]XP_042297654.1 SURP and G-patch domain-containing protein 2 [Sceloporus undulatus]
MTSRRMTRETFDTLMQVKAKRYRLDRSDPIGEALHQLRVHSRPAARTQYEEEEGDFHDNGKLTLSDWRQEPRSDYTLPSYRSSSQVAEEEDYYDESSTQPLSRNRDYVQLPSREREYSHSISVERDYAGSSSRDRDYGRSASREQNYSHSVSSREPSKHYNASYRSSELLGNIRSLGILEDDFGTAHGSDYDLEYGLEQERKFSPSLLVGRGKGRGTRGKCGVATHGLAQNKVEVAIPAKKWGAKNLLLADDPIAEPTEHARQRIVPSHRPRLYMKPQEKELKLDLVDPSDIFSTFGVEIIKWAGFDEIQRDPEYSELFQVLFTLETETCAKMLASFKCSLKPEHQDFCLSSIKTLQHMALRTPRVDGQFLNLLMEKQVMATKNSFFEVIGPFDRYVMKLQNYLLKSSTPLLMACNSFELSIKTSSFNDPTQMAAAFKTTLSLCRKSLALLGQTFALATTFRQEKILEALSIQEGAPSPTLFPNFDTSALFGREYIDQLQSWLEKTSTKMQLKKPATALQSESSRNTLETRPKIKILQRADRKVIATIEKLVENMVSGTLSGKEKAALRSKPEYWFLRDEESLEHKYYKLKLSEAERLMAKEGTKEVEKTTRPCESDALRRVLYAKKIASLKKKFFRGRRPGILQRAARAKKAKRVTVGTQTLLSAGMMLKPQSLAPQSTQSPEGAPAGPSSDTASTSASTVSPEEASCSGDGSTTEGPLGLPENPPSLECQFPDVDPKTMITAQKLAEFVAEVVPEIEQFSIENSADNPDLWFLQDRESSAFKFYRLKIRQLCPLINFGDAEESAEAHESPGAMEGDWENQDEMGPRSEMEGEEKDEGTRPTESSNAAAEGEASTAAVGLSEPSTHKPARGTPYGRKRISSKSLKVGLIPASKRVCLIDEPKVHDPVRIAYDRPRGYSTYKNKKQTSKDLEFCNKRLNQKNIGFQMLQKMGWKEGLGLGAQGKGIKEPVKVGSTSAGEGLGTGEKKEDNFATFRQRMIQMYYLRRANK